MDMNRRCYGNAVLQTVWILAVFLLAPRLYAADQIVTFQFYKVVMSDGSAATGTFNYDFTTKAASNIGLTIGNGYFDNSASAPTHISTHGISGSYNSAATSDELQFSFAATLSPTTGAALSTASNILIDTTVGSNDGGSVTTLTVASGSVLPVVYLPQTTVSLAGTPGANGWFKGNVTVTLTAAAGAHPVATTYYTLDGGTAQTYSGPFPVSSEAAHTLTYWSVDTGGFVETTHTVPVNIDGTPPISTEFNNGETITINATDNVSGVAAINYTVNGSGTQTYTGPVITPVGTNTVTYWAVDTAGNTETTHTVTFTAGDTIAPTAPVLPYIIAANTVVWLPSTDNVGVVGYQVQYYHGHSGKGGGYSWTTIATTTTPYVTTAYTGYSLRVLAYDAAGNVSAASGVSPTAPTGYTLTGTIALEGIADLSATGIPLDGLTVTLRLPGSTGPLTTQTLTLAPQGSASPLANFTATVSPGVFDVAIKAPKNLQVVIPNVMITTASSALPADLLLPAGDADNDNSVDTADFNVLAGAFGTSFAALGSAYDARADFNYDGLIAVDDFNLMVGEFGNSGDL